MDYPFPRAPYRGQAHPAPHCKMAQGRHCRRWTQNTRRMWRSARRCDLTDPGERLPALCVRPMGPPLAPLRGDMIVTRYADDTIVGFHHEHEARAFLDELKERMRQFELALHPDKTRLIRFGRHAAKQREKLGEGKPETFDFLGFTHFCTRSRK